MSIFSKNTTSQNNPEQDMQEQPDNFSQSDMSEEVDSEPVEQNFRSEAPVRSSINSKPSILSEGFTFEGTIGSDGVLNISGTVNCDDLNVGPLAHVTGNINYKYIHIQRGGKISGKFNKN